MNLQARLTESLKASQSALRVISQLESRLAEREAELKSVDQYAKEQYRAYDERLAEREKDLAEAKGLIVTIKHDLKITQDAYIEALRERAAAREDLKWAKRTIEEDKILISDYLEARSMAETLGEALDSCAKWIAPVMDGFSLPKNAKSRTQVLNKAKDALSLFEQGKKGKI